MGKGVSISRVDVEGSAQLPAPPHALSRGDHAKPAQSPRCAGVSRTKGVGLGLPLGADGSVCPRSERRSPRGQRLPFVASLSLVLPIAAWSLGCRPEPGATGERAPHSTLTGANLRSRRAFKLPGRLIRASHWSPLRSLIGCFLSNKVLAGAVNRELAHFPCLLAGSFEAVSEAGLI